ncbi:MFS transporter [Streptomyces sp. NPDC001833]|uniref:MFS transporter n=1 Tax=Streptomyces sp. NPDC001833 TaxID=3154658 RepID=UPI00331E5D05
MVLRTDTGPNTSPDRRSLRRLMAAGLIGSSLEWYDFFVYATASALVFGRVFFPDASPLTATLLSFSTFWAGFIARPIGGLIFGHVGDRVGRKPALVICLVTMGLATFTIGLLPTTSVIGAAAPIILVLLRFLQGIAIGGQWGGMTLLLTESTGEKRRGTASTFGQMGAPMGTLLGNASFLLVSSLVSGDAFLAWGWRIPFLLSALLLPVVLFIQLKVEDTPVFRELQAKAERGAKEAVKAPITEVIRRRPKRILLGAGLMFATNAITYICIAGLPSYATQELGVDKDPLLGIILGASVLGAVLVYLAGRFSDRIGRRPLVLVGAALVALWGFPFFWLVDTGSVPLIAVAVGVAYLGGMTAYGPLAAFLAELFEPRVRYSGMSLAYQLAAILVSGGTPFLMAAILAATDSTTWVSAFIAAMGLVTVVSTLLLPETNPRVGTPVPIASSTSVGAA